LCVVFYIVDIYSASLEAHVEIALFPSSSNLWPTGWETLD